MSGSQTTTTTTSGDGPTTSVSASGGSGTTVSTVPHENSSTPTPPQAAAEPTTEKPKPQEHDQTPSETTTPTPEETPATDDKQKSAQAVVGEKAAVTQPETGETVTAAAQTAEPKTAQTVVGPLARTTVATTAVTPPTFGLPTVTLPPYPTIPGVSPTRVAVAVVVVLGRALQTALSGPIPNPIAIPIYMVLVAAYQRLTEIALNHVPVVTQPTPALQVPVLGTITGTLVATDPDGDPLTFTYTQPTNGGLVVVTNVPLTNQYAYVYTPPLLGGGGPNSFTVTFDDTGVGDHFYAPNGHTTSYTVSLDVPTATVGPRDSIGVVRGGFAGGSVDGRTYSLANGNTAGATATSAFTTLGGIVSLNTTTGDWTYIPAVSGHNILGIPDNTDSFVVTVDDGVHGAVQTTVSVGADLGIAVTGANTNTSNGAYSGSLDIPVGDNGLLTYSVGTGPSSKGSVFVTSTGGFIYTPTPQARHAAAAANATAADKTDTFTIKGTDANGRSITVTTVSVNILPANSAPAGGTATFPAANANGVITGSVTGITDADGDTLTYTGTAGKGTVTFNGTTFTYTPTLDARHAAAADNAGTAIKQDTITITVDDGHGGTATFSSGAFNVTPQNTAPAYTNVGKSSGGVLGLTKTWTVNGMIDADDDTLTLAVTSLPSGGLLNLPVILGNTVTLVSLLTESGKTFVVTMSDGHGGKVPITLTI
ncbi:Ig-like domain-containing protein [Mycobacterium sp. ACS1612]|uniref:Ig-like domain-containing protein n=1 Tax=Mycobacterium sp. ACS1612 TaxID=1834117 RepID=UPI0012EA1D73|nr:Ig-like domain-containing protein [Mycobacterium sp. ACS1612]